MTREHNPNNPWYKEPWPWLLMLGPVTVIIAGFFTYYLAYNTQDSLVSDDYYTEGKNIIKTMNRDEEASKRDLSATIIFDKKLTSVRILLQGTQKDNGQIFLTIQHPTIKTRDQEVLLKKIGANMYQATLPNPLSSDQSKFWYITLEDKDKAWRLQNKWYASRNEKEVTLEPAITKK